MFIKLVITIAALITGFAAGSIISPVEADRSVPSAAVEQSTLEVNLVKRHTVEVIETPVTVIQNVEKIKTVQAELRNFESLYELTRWLIETRTSSASLFFDQQDNPADCDDYALALQQKGLAEGYIISFEIINAEEYGSLFTTRLPDSQALHAINLVLIGNSAYYIEPQTGEVVLAAYID